jgi:hypothetical protein
LISPLFLSLSLHRNFASVVSCFCNTGNRIMPGGY